MPTTKPDLSRLTIEQLHVVTGRTRRTITKLLAGLKPLSVTGKAKLYDARKALERIYLGQERLRAGDEQARLAKEKADAQALRNARERGELCSIDSRDRVVVALATTVSKRFQALPGKACHAVAAEGTPAGCRRILDEAVETALLELAQAGEEAASRLKGAHSERAA